MSLEKLRQEIDQLDQKLIKLLNSRARISLHILQEKQKRKLPIYDPQREEQIIQNVMQANEGPLTVEQVKPIFKIIIESCQNLQQQQKGMEQW